jgi:hypothetical protein
MYNTNSRICQDRAACITVACNMGRAAQTASKAEIAAVAFIGFAVIVAATAANQAWFDHHFLPSYWTPREEIVRNELLVRIGVGIIGGAIIFLARTVARLLKREPLYLVTISLAVVLAFGAAELLLRRGSIAPPRSSPA